MVSRHLCALLLAAIASAAFLGSALLPGRALVPFPPEHIPPLRSELAARGLAPEDLLQGNPTGGDKYNQSLAWDRIAHDRFRQGEWPLWTRDLGGGAPVVPQMGQIWMPWTWLLHWHDAATVYGPWFFAHQCAFGLLLYHFLRRLGVRHAAALFGMACAVVGLWTQARIHHNVILSAAVPLFGALSCVHALFAGARWVATGLLALAVGTGWLSGFPPVALQGTYLVLAFAVLCALRAPRGERVGPALRVALAFAIAGLIACPQMLPVLAAARDTARAVPTDAALRALSLGPAHLLTAWWPDLLNWAQPAFYGSLDDTRIPFAALWLLDQQRANLGNWQETAFAVGAPATALALAGVGGARRAWSWFFLAVGACGLLLALTATPLLLLSHAVPGARSGDFRRYLFLTAMALPVLAAFGADRWLGGERVRPAKVALGAFAFASAALFGLHLAPAARVQRAYAELAVQRYADAGLPVTVAQFEAAAHPREAADNRDRLLCTFGRAALAAGLGLLLLASRRGAALRVVGLAAVAVAELVHAGRGTIVAVEAERVTEPPAILHPALEAARAPGPRPRFQRIEPHVPGQPAAPTQLLQPNLGAFYGLEDLALYTPLPPRRLEEFWDCIEPPREGVPRATLAGVGVGALRRPETLRHPLCDVLGLRFVLSSAALAQDGLVDRTPEGWPGPERLYERTTCVPRATFLTRVRVVPDREERLRLLADPARDAVRELILEELPSGTTAGGEHAADVEVRVEAWDDERIELSLDAPVAGFVRVADPFDPGWTARVDGAPAPLLVADHFLRAVPVPAGSHRVVLAYDGGIVRWPPRLGLLGVLLAAGCLAAGGVRRRSARA